MRAGLLLCGVLFAATPALAQVPTPGKNPLNEICSGFLEQSGQGVSGDQAKLCGCLVERTQSQLTRPEMQAYAAASQNGQQPPPAVMEKVMNIAVQCLSAARQ
jgi:hypothetical protein